MRIAGERVKSCRDAGDRPLTVRQRLFIAGLLDGKSQTAAARDAGYAKPNVRGSELLKVGSVREYLRELFEEAGLTQAALARKIRDGLEAREYALHQASGEVVELGPDWNARVRFLQLAAAVTGLIPSGRTLAPVR